MLQQAGLVLKVSGLEITQANLAKFVYFSLALAAFILRDVFTRV
jgi:hypothetical protein